ncbi:LOW QUALITY PROTEIN: ATP-dependent DNA helicase RRM3 [Frankliniella fusca]|uniref:ATP-dependent DNA helicase n=1 Tax=Frankliniella fusca TaxID=407009 RepID=A0AAE1H931_9NEOP|nr:LOW QUALITY PROTEIN: ATP-dependent DNA helicase RRM3 [Frankliniella fusca]
MGYKHYSCTRDFIVINLNQFSWVPLNEPDGKKKKTVFETYINKDKELKHYCLLSFWKESELTEQDVDVLHAVFVPWKDNDHLNIDRNEKRSAVSEVFFEICCILNINVDTNVYSDSDSSSDESDNNEKDVLSNYNPSREPKNSTLDVLIDFTYGNLSKLMMNIITFKNYMTYKKCTGPEINFDVDLDNLNEQQMSVINCLTDQVHCVKNNFPLQQNYILVQGGAGTGKSYLLMCMYNFIISHLGTGSVIILSHTGVAAQNVSGYTINSVLHLGRNYKSFVSLTGDDLIQFQNKWRLVKFVFIDEYSFIGCRHLAWIENRLRQMADSNSLFGGYGVYFFGDCNQLSPIGDSPWFISMENCMSDNGSLSRVLLLVRHIQATHILTQSHRSSNIDFVSFLGRIAVGECTKSDLNCLNDLKKRNINMLSHKERKSFANALTLYGNPVAFVKAQNNCEAAFKGSDENADGLNNTLYLSIGAKVMLRRNFNVSLGLSNGSIGYVKRIIYYSGQQPPSVPAFDAVKPECLVAEVCGRCLQKRRNPGNPIPKSEVPDTQRERRQGHFGLLNVNVSLARSSRAECSRDLNPRHNYGGKCVYNFLLLIYTRRVYNHFVSENGVIDVPFKSVMASWMKGTTRCMPFVLSWACTIHKSQSLTLSKLNLDIGNKEFTLGLLYVAISRVSDYKNLMLLRNISLDRWNCVKKSKYYFSRLKFLDWLETLT